MLPSTHLLLVLSYPSTTFTTSVTLDTDIPPSSIARPTLQPDNYPMIHGSRRQHWTRRLAEKKTPTGGTTMLSRRTASVADATATQI